MRTTSSNVAFLAAVLSALFALTVASPWDSYNDPLSRWEASAERNFNALPLRADIRYLPWADSYWPNNNGGLAWRWNDRNFRNSFSYNTYSRQQLQQMSSTEISRLSPAEKYDIFVGDYSYSLTKSEWMRTSPNDANWEGLCHGWASAALQYAEPKPVTLRNRDGITVPFGSSDIKALLTYYTGVYADHRTLYRKFVGLRCNDDLSRGGSSDRACADINAGAFHVILANEIGLKGKGFIADIDRSFEVWNQPVSGYTTTVLSDNLPADPNFASPRAVKEIAVRTTMVYGDEYGPSFSTVGFSKKLRTFEYNLELDANNRIVGGWWKQFNRNDFHWSNQNVNFYGQFSALAQIYAASVGDVTANSIADDSVEAASAPSIDKQLTQASGTISLTVSSAPAHYNWLVSASNAIEIHVDKLNLAKTSRTVKVYDGATDAAKLLAVLSGKDSDLSGKVLRSSSSKVLIMYTSVDGGSASASSEGFSLYYKTL